MQVLLPFITAKLVHPPEHFEALFGTDSLILQALQVMGYGVAAVFLVLAVFYGVISAMKKLWPSDVD